MPKSAKKKKNKVSYKQYFVHYLFCLLVILLLVLTGVNIDKFLSNQKVLGTKIDTTTIQNEKSYWQKIVSDNPTYLDGYLELAKVEVQLGNTQEAQNYINQALQINPNSQRIPEIKKLLNIQN